LKGIAWTLFDWRIDDNQPGFSVSTFLTAVQPGLCMEKLSLALFVLLFRVVWDLVCFLTLLPFRWGRCFKRCGFFSYERPRHPRFDAFACRYRILDLYDTTKFYTIRRTQWLVDMIWYLLLYRRFCASNPVGWFPGEWHEAARFRTCEILRKPTIGSHKGSSSRLATRTLGSPILPIVF